MFKSTALGKTATEADEPPKKPITATPVVTTPRTKDPLGIQSLLPEWKKMFHTDTLTTDVAAGLTVGCVAVPLSLAIALASGVPAQVGLVTAAVSGVAGGLMGGTTLAVTGPAAAISLLVVGAVQQHGLEALPLITLCCGGLQVVSGMQKYGVVAKLVPVSVICGFTTGIGTMILAGQIPKALGMGGVPAGLNPIEILGHVATHASAISPAAASLALGTSAAMFFLPKLHPKMPSALVAVGGATLATHTMGLDVALVGTIPSGLEAFSLGLPSLPPMEALPSIAATSLLIYSMTSVESLLSCAALEKMRPTTYKHNPDQELVGQGVANIGSALFMGMPVTSVIARSSLNLKLGAATRLPALVQAGFVFSSVVFFSESIAQIPMPALSGMLVTTGVAMLTPPELKHAYAVKTSDAVPFAVTIGGMLSVGLAEGIGMGCLSALALNYNKGTERVLPTQMTATAVESSTLSVAQYQLAGPINFVSMFAIDRLIKELDSRQQEQHLSKIVVDAKEVTDVEFTGVEELAVRLLEVGPPVEMIQCSDKTLLALDQCDPTRRITRS